MKQYVYIADDGTEYDCNTCIWARRDGECAAWECEYVDKDEAYEAWKESAV